MKPIELRRALRRLGWSQTEAAQYLGVPMGQARISDWCRGERPIPPYIVASVKAHLALQECRDEVRRRGEIQK